MVTYSSLRTRLPRKWSIGLEGGDVVIRLLASDFVEIVEDYFCARVRELTKEGKRSSQRTIVSTSSSKVTDIRHCLLSGSLNGQLKLKSAAYSPPGTSSADVGNPIADIAVEETLYCLGDSSVSS